MDEPSASLDPLAEAALNELLLELTRSRTSIVISHRLSTCRSVDRILYLEGGRIAEQGSHDELIARGGRYAALWEAQARQYRSAEAGA